MSGYDLMGDDGWTEIVGEQTRGGGGARSIMGAEQAFEVLGELMAKSPAFKQYAEKRAAASRPMVTKRPISRERDWNIDFGPISGAAGTTTTITSIPQVHFRAEKVMATDSYGTAGYGTRIQSITVGQESQRPVGSGAGTLTAFFANNALGNGIKWDTCEKALTISITVSFIQSCTFDMSVFGKCIK